MSLSVQDYLNAIKGSRGVVTRVARNLGIDSRTVTAAINTYPEIAFAMVQEKENTLDDIEERLMQEAEDGKAWAIKYYLDSQGHRRGYGVPALAETAKGFTLNVVYETPKELEEPTEDVLAIEGVAVESEGSEDIPQETSQETSGVLEESIQEESS